MTCSPFQALVDAFAGTSAETDDDWIEFFTEDLCVIANVIDNAARLRIRVYLPRDDEDLVTDWVAQQPKPTSGLLQAAYTNEGQCRPRLVFERPTGDHDWLTDPMLGEVGRYLAAWLDDRTTDRASGSLARFTIPDDPRDVAPANAWLLKGTEASPPTREALEDDRAAANVGIFTREWTTTAQTQIGDLALFYFLNPRKAVHFVARAASNAYFSNNIPVVAHGAVNSAQWWAYFTTPIEIEPITVGQLRSAVGGYLPLRGRSGLYLRPETIEALSFRAVDPMQQAEQDWIVSVPVGLARLPSPVAVTVGNHPSPQASSVDRAKTAHPARSEGRSVASPERSNRSGPGKFTSERPRTGAENPRRCRRPRTAPA